MPRVDPPPRTSPLVGGQMGLRNKSVANSPQEGQRIGHEEDRVVSDQSCLAQRTDRLRLTEVQNKAEIKVKDEAEQGAVTSPLVSFPSHFLPLNLNLSLNLPLNAPRLTHAPVCLRPPV